MYFAYLKERVAHLDFIKKDHGFIVYTISKPDDMIFVCEMYIEPRFRNARLGSNLVQRVEAIGVEAGLSAMISNIDLAAQNYKDSLRAALAYGFEISGTNGTLIYLFKEIGGK